MTCICIRACSNINMEDSKVSCNGDDVRLSVASGSESCEFCHSTENLRRCSRCQRVFYCCKDHQLQDWRKHRRTCKKLVVVGQAHNEGGSSCQNSKKNFDTRSRRGFDVTNDNPKTIDSVSESDREARSKISEMKILAETKVVDRNASQNTSGSNLKVCQNGDVPKTRAELKPQANGVTRIESLPNKSLFDPRPYVHTDFPRPKSRDGDTVARHAAAHLQKNGYCILDDFVRDRTNSLRVLEEVKSIRDSGVMVDGPLSGGRTSSEKSQKFTEKAIRGDQITWLQGNEACYPNIKAVISQTDELAQRLNFYLPDQYTIRGRTKAMVACYPGNGTGYACHVDNPNKDGRCITCLYYLNENWDIKTQGGLLRLLPTSGGHVDVQPVLNRLLLFWSDRRNPHEVQPAFDMRFAITVWYFDKTEREEAKMAQLNEDMNRLQGEVALPRIMAAKEKKNQVEQKIKKTSQKVVAGLSPEELQALMALLEGQSDPRATLTNLGVAPSIQEALLCQLEKTYSSGH